MLKYLHIENLAVVSSLELELEPGFTVITGETGAGKSIMLRSIGLLLGDRGDSDMVRSGADKALVEGEFDISHNPKVQAVLEEKGLTGDDPATLLVRRQLGGRQRVWINSMTASVSDLCEITSGLMEVSGQHEHQLLTRREHHIELLDRFAGLEDTLAAYQQSYGGLRDLIRQKNQLSDDIKRREQLLDDIRYSIEEIETASLKSGELEDLEDERRRLSNIVRLSALVGSADQTIYSGEQAAVDKLGLAVGALRQAAQIDPKLQTLSDNISGVADQLGDLSRELSHYLDHLEENPARLDEVEERLELIRRLQRKYGQTVEDILAKLESLKKRQQELENGATSFANLENLIAEQGAKTLKLAQKLTSARGKAAGELTAALVRELSDLGMPKSRLKVEFSPYNTADLPKEYMCLGPTGQEHAELLFSSNPGQELKPLARIASGGELSRVMLAFKVVLADRDAVSAYLFDEVDTGVGGGIGEAIGRKIAKISANKQAITITHLPQLAACARNHLFLCKVSDDSSTASQVKVLDKEARVNEIARMLDGEHLTDTGREHARTLLETLGK